MAATNKNQVIEALRTEQGKWVALLDRVGPDRVTWEGAIGDWSVKDIVAHTTAWEGRVVAWLEAIRDGRLPDPPPWRANMSESEINDWICKSNRSRAAKELIAESKATTQRVIELVEKIPEDDLFTPNRFDWLGGQSVAEAIPGDSYAHMREHADAVRAWLEKLPQEVG